MRRGCTPLPKVLNVGGGGRYLPDRYAGWEQVLLDIDPDCKPDLCMDATELVDKTELYGTFDAAYCSHTLEHFYPLEVRDVLDGMANVLKDGGTVEVICPDLNALIDSMRSRSLDVTDVWYRVGGQPITFHDALYGWQIAIRQGKFAYAHKCGFTAYSLAEALGYNFSKVEIGSDGFNLFGKAVKTCP